LGESNEFFAEFGDMTEYEGLTFEERVLSSSSQPEIQQRRYEEMVNRARAERLDSPDEQVVYIFSHSYTQEVGSGPRGPCREREWILLGGGETGGRQWQEERRWATTQSLYFNEDLGWWSAESVRRQRLGIDRCMSLDLETVQAVKKGIAMVASLLIHHHFKLDDKNTTIILNAEETVFFQRFPPSSFFKLSSTYLTIYPPQDDREEKKEK
jgi:hypothetical protein